MQALLDELESGSREQEVIDAAFSSFYREHQSDSQFIKDHADGPLYAKLLEQITSHLQRQHANAEASRSTLPEADKSIWSVLRIISRDSSAEAKVALDATLLSRSFFDFLIAYLGLDQPLAPQPTEGLFEALKCLINILFYQEAYRAELARVADGLLLSHLLSLLVTPVPLPASRFVVGRLLFYATLDANSVKIFYEQGLFEASCEQFVHTLQDDDLTAGMEWIKVLYNVTLEGPWTLLPDVPGDKVIQSLHTSSTLQHQLNKTKLELIKPVLDAQCDWMSRSTACSDPSDPEAPHQLQAPHRSFVGWIISFWSNLPLRLQSVYLHIREPSLTLEGDMLFTPLLHMLHYCHRALAHTLAHPDETEYVSTGWMLLTKWCQMESAIRRALRKRVLPGKRADSGASLLALMRQMLRRMGPELLKSTTEEFIFALCRSNPSRMVYHVGIGEAAGLLQRKGLLGAVKTTHWIEAASPDQYVSSDEDMAQASPPAIVQATTQSPRPVEHMTEAEEEAEAERLAMLMDRLQRSGVIQIQKSTDNK